MLKKIGIGILVIAVFAVMLVFTSSNSGFVDLDLFFLTIRPSIPLAFSVNFVIGWVFGLRCTVVFILRLVKERRQLRRKLGQAEAEGTSLRNLPIADADLIDISTGRSVPAPGSRRLVVGSFWRARRTRGSTGTTERRLSQRAQLSPERANRSGAGAFPHDGAGG